MGVTRGRTWLAMAVAVSLCVMLLPSRATRVARATAVLVPAVGPAVPARVIHRARPRRALKPAPVARVLAGRPNPAPRPVAVLRAPVVAVPPSVPTCGDLAVSGAPQVVLVRSTGTAATIEARSWDGRRWLRSLGPFFGYVGYNGVAYGGSKREGDGRTPAGVYPLGEGFGVQANPGLVFGWRSVSPSDVWVDDPTSSFYNTWQRTPSNGRWRSAENLNNSSAYSFAQVVAYNPQRTPYAGSAIFLHADGGGPTAGCVSLPVPELLSVFRWERPGVVIAIS